MAGQQDQRAARFRHDPKGAPGGVWDEQPRRPVDSRLSPLAHQSRRHSPLPPPPPLPAPHAVCPARWHSRWVEVPALSHRGGRLGLRQGPAEQPGQLSASLPLRPVQGVLSQCGAGAAVGLGLSHTHPVKTLLHKRQSRARGRLMPEGHDLDSKSGAPFLRLSHLPVTTPTFPRKASSVLTDALFQPHWLAPGH